MPTLSTTIEDTSPVIIYSGNGGDWVAGSSTNDSLASLYSQGSFTLTSRNNANASFSFYGTGVQIFGAKRNNHGPYQVTIDSTTYAQVSGQAADPGSFQTSLFSTVALTNGFHKVTIVNQGSTFLDIDFITWQTPVGSSDEPLLSSTIQDSESAFVYTPESAWNGSPPNVGMFSGGTGHTSTTAGSSVEFTFTGKFPCQLHGSAVEIFGPVGPSGAVFSAQLDSSNPTNFTTNKPYYRPQQLLFQAGNLGNGKHTVKFIQQSWDNSALSFSIDFAQVFTTPSLQQRLSVGAKTGIAIGVVAILAAAIAALIIFLPSKYLKFFRLKGRSVEKGTISGPFLYQRVSGDLSAGIPPQSAPYGRPTHSAQPSQSLSNYTPPSSGFPSSGGTYAPSSDTLIQGPNSQVISIPFTADGKYRPDLPSTPQLLPPPGTRRDPTPSSSRSHLSVLPPGAAQPGVISDDELGMITQETRQGTYMTPLRRPTTASLAWTEPPQYQR
ncbi:A type blood alpha-D-galactosamine galactosaminidase [Psilocybe cubensis]|uniref:A type blood alpha-D-galactosamine galactosaminidase n=1 Tax=Psilocybe cubensis TaxID=181762 RepID=A0ACB8HBD5_PSICU|nr:A type blood alpha-D-galactosamine galactosaminidase [Psilocybe cubensis]KAH9484977.1 A type blood alpha-D-galactosamine galactosaminidase [Psilocybe cubensis]